MSAEGRQYQEQSSRLKKEVLQDRPDSDESEETHTSHKRRRPWKEENRREGRASKKQRQRNPEWND